MKKCITENGKEYEVVIDENQNVYWILNGKYHREKGPAQIAYDLLGYRTWYQNGLLHRLDGPAVIYSNSRKYWCVNNVITTEQKTY
jgi:hypothetical protein